MPHSVHPASLFPAGQKVLLLAWINGNRISSIWKNKHEYLTTQKEEKKQCVILSELQKKARHSLNPHYNVPLRRG